MVPDPAGRHRVVGAEVVAGQLLGVDQPARHRPARPWSTGVVAGGRGQLAAAVPGRLHRAEERRAHLVVLQLPYGRRGGATRGGDPLAQHRRVLAGLPEHLGRAEHGLHHQLGGDVPGQPEVDAGLDHRLDDEEQVRRTGAGDRRHRILVALRHRHHPAGRGEDLGDPVQVVLVACVPGGDGGHPLVDQGRGVGHHPDHGDASAARPRSRPCRPRPPARPPGCRAERPGDLGQQLGHVLRLDHQDHRVRLGGRFGVLQHGDAVRCDAARPAAPAAGRWPRSGRRVQPARIRPDSTVSPITPAPRMASSGRRSPHAG